MKKIISLFMAFVMLLSVTSGLTFTVYADEQPNSGKCGDAASWGYDETEKILTISGTGDMYDFFDTGALYDDVTMPWINFAGDIQSVIIEDGITSIGYGAFDRCVNLLNVKIPNTVKVIGGASFQNCGKLKNIDIPEGVKKIESNAFSFCQKLEKIEFPSTLEELGNPMSIYLDDNWIESNVKTEFSDVFLCCASLKSIYVDENNNYISSQDGVLFNKNKTELISYPDSKSDSEYYIPDTVKYVDEDFWCNQYLEKLNVPKSVLSFVFVENGGSIVFDNFSEFDVDENNTCYS